MSNSCEHCGGSGYRNIRVDCIDCHGKGCGYCDQTGSMEVELVCDHEPGHESEIVQAKRKELADIRTRDLELKRKHSQASATNTAASSASQSDGCAVVVLIIGVLLALGACSL